MTKAEEFEMLKAKAIKNYEHYIKAIRDFSYVDVKNLNKRILLLDSFNKAVLSNAAYRDFINKDKLF